MSISMMYQFENKLFSLPAKFFDFLVLPPPPLKKILALHLWKYTKQKK